MEVGLLLAMEDVALESFPLLRKSAALIEIADGGGYPGEVLELDDFLVHSLLPATMVHLAKDMKRKALEKY